MTADVSRSYARAAPAEQSGLGRTAMAAFGVAAVLVGGVLLFDPFLLLVLGLQVVVFGVLLVAACSGSRTHL
jgi:uncharacterized membrane protein HdeD (DUF308 family)